VRFSMPTSIQTESRPWPIRSVYGQWLPWLILMDRAWTEQNLERIFPEDESLAELRDAAWRPTSGDAHRMTLR
jgi:hypothetical protein